MDLPTKVIIGYKLLSRISQIYPVLSSHSNIVVISGSNVFRKYSHLLEEGFDKFDKVPVYKVSDSSWETINYLVERLSIHSKSSYIIGIGGGKTIDVAKMVSHKLKKHFISIPTAPSHDGISSQFVSIRDASQAYSYLAHPPQAIIVDIDIISSAPRRLIASGVGDALAKFTAVKDWYLSKVKTGEYYGDYSANLALLGAKMVSKHAGGIGRGRRDSIRVLVEALISDGVAAGIAGSSRPCSGSEHLFSHALDIYSSQHALHGEQCGVGTIIMMYLHGYSPERVRKALKKAGAPTNAEELGIDEDNVVKALAMAKNVRPERYTILNEVRLDERRAKKVARDVDVI